MKIIFASAFLAAAFVQSVIGQTFTINTPANVVVCQPVMFTWSGGTAPYFLRSAYFSFRLSALLLISLMLSILPGAQPTAAALIDFGRQNGTSLTWKANIAVGTSLGLTLRDSNGLIAQSAPFTVNNGTDTTCVGQALSTSAGPAVSTTAASTTAPATTAPASTTTPPSGPAAAAGTSTKPTSTAPGSTGAAAGNSKGAASPSIQFSQIGLAGVVGAAALALLA